MVNRLGGGRAYAELKKYFDASPNKNALVREPAGLRNDNVPTARDLPAEDFSFFECRLAKDSDNQPVEGMIYYPHPETKPEFFQDSSTLEILAPFLPGITFESRVKLQLREEQVGLF